MYLVVVSGGLLLFAGCRPEIPDDSLSTSVVLSQESVAFIEPIYHSGNNRTYVRFREKDGETTFLYDPINDLRVALPNLSGSYTELENGSLAFYPDQRDSSLQPGDNLPLVIISPTKMEQVGNFDVEQTNVRDRAFVGQDESLFLGFVNVDSTRFMYGGQLFQYSQTNLAPGPRTDFYYKQIGNIPLRWVDQPPSNNQRQYFPFTCDAISSGGIEFPSVSHDIEQTPLFYPSSVDDIDCLRNHFDKVFILDSQDYYVFMKDPPMTERDILPVSVFGRGIRERISKVYSGRIHHMPQQTDRTQESEGTYFSPHDSSTHIQLSRQSEPYGISQYFRYTSLALNGNLANSLHRSRIDVLGFTKTAVFILSERGVERINLEF